MYSFSTFSQKKIFHNHRYYKQLSFLMHVQYLHTFMDQSVSSVCMEGMPDRANTLSTYSIKGHVLNIQIDPSITEKMNTNKTRNFTFQQSLF